MFGVPSCYATLQRLVRSWRNERFARKCGNYPPQPFRTHGLAVWWYDHGRPCEIGALVRDKMRSGRTAIFRLVNVEGATGVDWSWYDFEFVRYEDVPNARNEARRQQKQEGGPQ